MSVDIIEMNGRRLLQTVFYNLSTKRLVDAHKILNDYRHLPAFNAARRWPGNNWNGRKSEKDGHNTASNNIMGFVKVDY